LGFVGAPRTHLLVTWPDGARVTLTVGLLGTPQRLGDVRCWFTRCACLRGVGCL